MSTWVLVVLVIGVNYVVWGTIGFLRWCDERTVRRWSAYRHRPIHGTVPVARHGKPPVRRLKPADIAVLMAAHDEELVIEHSLRAIKRLVPVRNVHVVSDWSTDRTVVLARRAGALVVETETNVGKAGALRYGLQQFRLTERFEAVLILDADTQLDRNYFTEALPLLDDPEVVAVAGCAETRWQPRELSTFGAMIVAHRQRIYTLTQRLLKYGQTWRGVNATHIVPGFASIYRSRALREIEVNPPGLVIEDFNMTFEVYAKRLGRVAFTPRARAFTQDPSSYRAYVRQTKRWALGLWQTLRRHRPRPRLFSLMLVVLIGELLTSSLFFVVLPLVLLVLGGAEVGALAGLSGFAAVKADIDQHVSLAAVGYGVFLPDYALTCCVALLEKRPRYLYLGLLFMVMRVTDAVIALYTLPRAWSEKSSGRWVSPPRRSIAAEERADSVA